MKKPIDQVRQVLMNEMGLTREMVREVTESIVRETVEKHINRILDNGKVLTALIEAANETLRRESDKQFGGFTMEGLVRRAAKEVTEQFVKDHLRVVGV